MKKYKLFFICLLFSFVACTTKYDVEIVHWRNFPYSRPLWIDTANCRLLTIDNFDAKSCDTIGLHRLNKEAEEEIAKRIHEMHYESELRRGYTKQLDMLPIVFNNFFLYGKLDLQPNVTSLILLEYDEMWDDYITFSYVVSKKLWLANIREDKLYSIVWLDYYSSFFGTNSFSRTPIALNNKIFTKTCLDEEYFLFRLFGQRNWNSYETKTIVHFRVNEEGYIQVLEEGDWKFYTDKLDKKDK